MTQLLNAIFSLTENMKGQSVKEFYNWLNDFDSLLLQQLYLIAQFLDWKSAVPIARKAYIE